MSEDELADNLHTPHSQAATSDVEFMAFAAPQPRESYEKACFGGALRALLPFMTLSVIAGGSTASFVWPSFWNVQDDDKAGASHFVRGPDICFPCRTWPS